MRSINYKYIQSVGVALLMVTGLACSDSVTGDNGNGTPTPTPTPTPEAQLIFEDLFISTADSTNLTEHTPDVGNGWSGGMTEHWYVEGANNYAAVGYYPIPNPTWAVADAEPETANYSAQQIIIPVFVNPGAVREWHHMWVGVRHNGAATDAAPDGETVYALNFAGDMEGVRLYRRIDGEATLLAHDDEYTAIENEVVHDSEIWMKLEAKTVDDEVILNAWISIDGGDVTHIFEDIVDDSADRILDIGNPAYGSSAFQARLVEVEAWSVIVE